ncbi:tyrosine-protein phosphatase [Salisediminibacterium halotolerans]|uniref:Tyrosine-protein phosphatase n=1 Tax=Salisediminibacterium halotolerans TaxID=517425 RepID=A0A1H9QIQ7_9BACI|nr:CpsB/CapC family capsule biosynthesis tyrosine phosphatase [Salisediminibacterium haloalkalitolerans]SER60320.1 protein-tyrosine phosphatase [Salisediminibacterium haloalkalitolerans]
MIDTHSHILPGIDDGAKTLDDTLAMADAAIAEGITEIAATPHHQNGPYINEKADVRRLVTEANEHLQKNGRELTILPGQEVRLYGELIADWKNGLIQTINDSNYVYVEFPSAEVPAFAGRLFYDMQVEGLTPVIVHPERNQGLIKHPSQLYEFVRSGVLTQVTAASLTGRFGSAIETFSWQLIDHKLTHIIASDAHNTVSRGFMMKDAFAAIEAERGEELAAMFQANAEDLVDGRQVIPEPPQPIERTKKRRKKRSKFLGLF